MYFLTSHDYIELIYQSLTGILLILLFNINKRVENPLKGLPIILLPTSSSPPAPVLTEAHDQYELAD